jgi:SP family myo-inositol transporter-like MFS transporter 13
MFGSILSIYFIDKTGRKKLALISLFGVVLSVNSIKFREKHKLTARVSIISEWHNNSKELQDNI